MKKSFKMNDLFDRDLAFIKAILTICGTALTAFGDNNLIEQTEIPTMTKNDLMELLEYSHWRQTAHLYKNFQGNFQNFQGSTGIINVRGKRIRTVQIMQI